MSALFVSFVRSSPRKKELREQTKVTYRRERENTRNALKREIDWLHSFRKQLYDHRDITLKINNKSKKSKRKRKIVKI